MNHISYLLKLIAVPIIYLSSIFATYATDKTAMRGITAMQATAEMAPGINLYNTLDANTHWDSYAQDGLESEICWGNPYTTFEMVKSIADRGFKTLRVPVTWYNHMGGYPEYTIDTAWMDRVEEVVNYGLDNGMYVVLNMHHEDLEEGMPGKWLTPTYEMQDSVTYQLEKVWTQIATRFKDYGDYLVFETMNEPRPVGTEYEWNGGSDEHRDVVNALNLAAVNTIRGIGGNNETRFILMPQVAAKTHAAEQSLVIPNDDPNTIVSVHAYKPYSFCLDKSGPKTFGTPEDVVYLENIIKSLHDVFVANGQPVIIGEWGVEDKSNDAERVKYYKLYSDLCVKYDITTFTWFYSLNRRKLVWEQPLLEEAILQAYNPDVVLADDITLNTSSEHLLLGETFQLTAEVSPLDVTFDDVIWFSSDRNVAIVSSTGLIKTKGPGTATISATALGKTIEMELTVEEPTAANKLNVLDFYVLTSDGDIIINCQSCIASETSVSIVDIYGKTVKTITDEKLFVEGKYTITSNDLKTGVYFIKVSNKETQAVKRIIYTDK